MSDGKPTPSDVISEFDANRARKKATDEALLRFILNEDKRRADEYSANMVRNEMDSPAQMREFRRFQLATSAMQALIEDGWTTGLEVEAFDIADRMMAEWERRKAKTEIATTVTAPDDTEPSRGDEPA